METVFVYGTLRRHEDNAHYLQKAERLAEQCWTAGRLYDTGVGYPALVPSEKEWVYGELYRVSRWELALLDELEDYFGPGRSDNLYERVTRTVHTDRGTVKAYVYMWARGKDGLNGWIRSGDWKVYRHLQRSPWLCFVYAPMIVLQSLQEQGAAHLFSDCVGRGKLAGYSLRIIGRETTGGERADLVEGGGEVEGKVYRIGREALEYLWKRAAVHQGLYRPAFIDLTCGEKQLVDVLTFLAVKGGRNGQQGR